MAVFWDVAPCSLVEVYQRFRGPCCLHHQGHESLIALIMEAASTSETLVNFCQTTRRYILEDSHLRFNTVPQSFIQIVNDIVTIECRDNVSKIMRDPLVSVTFKPKDS
jgi:hypothetical protein